jgi:hypothetical protein
MEDVLMRLTRFGDRLTDESGMGVISAVLVGMVVIMSGATWLSFATHQVGASSQDRDRERAFGAAEAGVHAAMNHLSFNATACPTKATAAITEINGASYRWWIDQSVHSCSNLTERVRYIVAQGWVGGGPNDAGVRRRQVEQQIKLKPVEGFKYAMFASPGGISADQSMNITGDVYAERDFVLSNNSNIYDGGIIGQQSVTITGSSHVGKDIWALGDIAINHSSAKVLGDVKTSGGPRLDASGNVFGAPFAGNIINSGTIDKKAIAPGAITGSGVFSGGKVTSAVTPPPKQQLPGFNTAAVPYTQTWGSASAFNSHFSANASAFKGVHRVTDLSSSTQLNSKFTVVDPLTMVVADGKIVMSRNIDALNTTDKFTMALVSLSNADDAIRLTNNNSFPPNVSLTLFAPYGCVNFSQLKTFSGAVYARCIISGNQMNLTYLEPASVPGVDWTTAAVTRFLIEAHVFREVPFKP